jgi:hypothetical protein
MRNPRRSALDRRVSHVQSIAKTLKPGAEHGLLSSFHHLFWMGDLNYRVNYGTPSDFSRGVPSRELSRSFRAELQRSRVEDQYRSVMAQDQLRREQQRRQAFVDFHEGSVTFPPTYKVRHLPFRGF